MSYKPQLNKQTSGKIMSIQDNVIIASGLNHAFLGEVVRFKTADSDIIGQILNLERNLVRIVIIKGKQSEIEAGDTIHRTFQDAKTRVGFHVLGKLVSPLGDIINEEEFTQEELFYSELISMDYVPVERGAPGIIEREPVRIPFLTGTNAVDSFIPVGCGQRELIIGDQNTGKTSMAITAILNQKRINNKINKKWRSIENNTDANNESNSLRSSQFYKHSSLIPCIYVGIGQKRSEISRIKNLLETAGALKHTTLVFTSSDDTASIQFLAPYAGCAIGEWSRDNGYKAVVIYDDLSQHAVAYRQMSLLLRRPPGREAYPGDVFYVHSRLLERAAQLHRNIGGGSLTALPVIETRGGDISAYIPTNVISITDGQIFLSSDLSNKGYRPAINIGLSVSRVGSNAQTLLMKELSRKLKGNFSFYNQYKGIDKLGGDIDPIVLSHITRGKRIEEFFKQGLYEPCSYIKQVIGIYCVINGFVDNIQSKYVDLFFHFLFNYEFITTYLTASHFHFINEADDIESWLYSNIVDGTDEINEEINNWCKETSEFFITELQPRLARDPNNVIYNSLKILKEI